MNTPLTPLFKKGIAHRNVTRVAWLATALAFCVIVFGAFVRLSDAGLSCPDWPTCYGKAAWPTAETAHKVVDHAATAIRAVDPTKAWREQLHRHLASILGLLVFGLALATAYRRPKGWQQIVGAAVLTAIAIPLQMKGFYAASTSLVVAAEIILLFAAFRWDNSDLSRVGAITLAVIIFQAILGMWTVTWLLKPVVVMAHLIGGLTTFALLTWMAWRSTDRPIHMVQSNRMRMWVIIGIVLLGAQIALGGWTSANYAALACGVDFPKCAGQWMPPHNFSDGFVLWRGVGVDYEGGVLDAASRIAIQLAHRAGAVIAGLYVLILGIALMRTPGLRGRGAMLAIMIIVQIALGISNVVMGLPLWVAVLHNAGAALLLYMLVSLLARIREVEL